MEEDFWLEIAQIQAESIGWISLDEGAYLHVGSDAPVIQVVGIAKKRWLALTYCGQPRSPSVLHTFDRVTRILFYLRPN